MTAKKAPSGIPPAGAFAFSEPTDEELYDMWSALLSRASLAVLPAGAGPFAAVLLPALAYVIAHYEEEASRNR